MKRKKPRLFYYEESIPAWSPVPDKVENIISTDCLADGETITIEFKRKDMTDSEFATIPEC